MVKSVDIAPDGKVRVEVYLTVAGCPLRDTITRDVTAAVAAVPGVSAVAVHLDVMSEEQRRELQTRLRGGPARSARSRSPSRHRSPRCSRSPAARAGSASRR
jgi:ATP-binding protein involved in chromosome partitioning